VSSGAAGSEPGYAGVFQTLRETPPAARLVLLGVFVNQFGAFLQFFLVLYLTQRGFSKEEAGIALGAYSVGAIVGVLLGGALADRLGARWTIVFSVSSAALFTLSVTALDSLPTIVAAVALSGAMTQAARPAVSSLLFSMVPPARQVMVFAMYRTALNSGVVAGPLVAVWLSTISWNLVFYFDAASALTYAAIAAFLLPGKADGKDGDGKPSPEGQSGQDGQEETAAQRRAGYLTVLRDARYLAYLALMLANGLVHVQFFAVLPLQLKDAGYPTWAYGSMSAMSAFIVIACELLVTRTTQKWPAWIAVIAGWVLLVIGRGLWGLPGGLTIIFAGTLLAAIGQIIGGPAAFAYPAKVAKAGATGRYIGSAHAMFGLGYAIGPLLGIVLWGAIGNGFWALCVAFGLIMTLAGIWGMQPARQAQQSGTGADVETGTGAGSGAEEAEERAGSAEAAERAPEPETTVKPTS